MRNTPRTIRAIDERTAGSASQEAGAAERAIFAFDAFELDDELGELTRAGERVEIQRKALDLLILLLRQRGQFISRDEALRSVWSGVFVSPNAFSQTLHKLKQALGCVGDDRGLFETRRGLGVRIPADRVRVVTRAAAAGGAASVTTSRLQEAECVFLLEREGEMAQIDSAVAGSGAGRGHVVLISGEAGIGKTSLATAAAARAREGGFAVHVGRAPSHHGVPPFTLWSKVLVSLAESCHGPALATALGARVAYLAQAVPELRAVLDWQHGSPLADPAHSRFHCFQATLALVREACSSQPVLLVLEDLHRADSTSLLLTQFLARHLASLRGLLLVTYRAEEVTAAEGLEATLLDLRRLGDLLDLRPRGLSPTAVREMLRRLTGVGLDEAAGSALHRRTGGNPFFLSQCASLLRGGRRAGDPDAGESGEELDLLIAALPPGAVLVAAGRIARLSATCRRLLGFSALLAEEAAVDVVASAAGLGEAEALDALEEAVRAAVIEELENRYAQFRFCHELIREAIVSAIAPAERAEMHAQLARTIEARHAARLDPYVEALAYHHGAASGDVAHERALEFSERAGHKALESFHYEEAARHFCEALALLDRVPAAAPHHRTELLSSLGAARIGAGAIAGAREAFREALERASAANDTVRFARAALGYATRPIWPDWREPVRFLEEALATLERSERELRVRLQLQLALWLGFDLSQRARAMSLPKIARAEAEALGDPKLVADSLLIESALLTISGAPDRDECLRLTDEALALALSAGDRVRATGALHEGVRPLLELGRFAEADARFARFDAAARAIDLVDESWQAPLYRGMRHAMRGEYEDAAREVGSVAHAAEEMGPLDRPETLRVPGVQAALWVLQRDRGIEIEAARTDFTSRWFSDAALVRSGLTLMLAEEGHLGLARDSLERLAASDFAPVRSWSDPVGSAAGLAEACALLGERAHAAALYRMLLPHASTWVVLLECAACAGPVALYLGIAAIGTEDFAAAERHFEAALAVAEAEGARPWIARICVWWSRVLLQRGSPGDGGRARALCARATALAASLGMARLLSDARQLERSLIGAFGA